MRSVGLFLALVIAATVATGCAGKGDADQVANTLFEAVKKHEYKLATSYYSPAFFGKTPKEAWIADLEAINGKLGDLQSWKLTSWRVNTQYGTTGNGTYYQFVYDTKYSKYPAIERLTLFKPVGSKEPRITGHRIESAGFLRE